MRWPRLSLASSVWGIFLVAVNLTILREDLKSGEVWRHAHLLIIGVLPMASLLLWALSLGLVGLIRRGELSPYLIGFEMAGWAMLFLIVLLDAATDDSEWGPIGLASPLLQRIFPRDDIDYREYSVLFAHFILFLAPPLIASLIGGWLVSRSGIRVVRLDGGHAAPEEKA